MDMKKTAKKIAALVAGTTMLGATIMGAAALDLGNYPAPFVTDGVFDGKIVVGAKAMTSDVVGAIDLAASLQALATKTSNIAIPGAAGTASVTGDSAEFKTGSDIVSFNEVVGSVKGTFTELDLKALKSGVFESGTGSTPVKQYLKFDAVTGAYVMYGLDNSDEEVLGDFLYVPEDSYIFEYQVEFTEGAESDVETDGALDDFEGEVLTLIGSPFTIVEAKLASTASTEITLSMLGGQVADVLRDGETKTYTIDGKDYEVTAVFISNDPAEAKLSVNGVMTKEMAAGETKVLSNDVTVGVQSILTNQREGMVEFYLGANKLELVDADYSNGAYVAGTVEVGGEAVDGAELDIKATNQTGFSLKLNYIKYRTPANDDYYVAAGHGLKAALGADYEDAMLTGTWDITYAGLVKTAESEIKFDAVSDHSYKLAFENLNGEKYDFPLLTNKDGVFKYGDDDDNFLFKEFSDGNTSAGNLTADKNTFIKDGDYFIVSDRVMTSSPEKAVTKVLRYTSLSTADSTVTFKDLAGGDIVVSYSGALGSAATGELIVSGASHDFYVGADNANDYEAYALSMDLDASGAVTNGNVVWGIVKGGGIIDFDNTTAFTYNVTGGQSELAVAAVVDIITIASKFDESTMGQENTHVTINATGTEIGLTMTSLEDDPLKDEYSYDYSNYGVFFERYAADTGSAAPELTVKYPGTQRYPQVFVTAGVVEVKEGAAAAAGTIQSTTLNPIAVGLAVLDTDVLPAGTKVIVVGGPCVNAKAAELMGNPAECTAGFTPGKAVIKLFADKNALLVAGYGAQDTMGACYVLAEYKDYKLSGTEVEVVVADLNTITVNKIA